MNEPEIRPYAVVVADAHIDGERPALDDFLSFLSLLPSKKIHSFYMLGDLFNLWFGTPRLQLSYHLPVLAALQSLRAQGIELIYVEGNRDYFLAPYYLGAPFSAIASESSQTTIGTRRIHFAHGDLVNREDRPYRVWRNFSRNRIVYGIFHALPSFIALGLANYLEAAFRGANRKHKSAFPTAICKRYAHALFEHCDIVILGHFHQQFHQTFHSYEQFKHLYALPAWKDTYMYLEIDTRGECLFTTFRG